MKKIHIAFLSILSVFLFAGSRVSALDYTGPLGYDLNQFRYLSEDTNIKVNLVISSNGEEHSYEMINDPDNLNVHVLGLQAKDNDEYYFKVCKKDEPSICENKLDPFAKYINKDGSKNVVINNPEFKNNWEGINKHYVKNGFKSIYALDAKSFTKGLSNSKSIFELLTFVEEVEPEPELPTPPSETTALKSTYKTGIDYLIDLPYTYLEIADLYDKDNYFYVNREYSNKENPIDVLKEYQAMILGLEQLEFSVILRTNFTSLTENLKQSLIELTPNAIVGGKLNFDEPIVQRYLMEVYKFWLVDNHVDGFYIEDSSEYDQEFLANLIKFIDSMHLGTFVYTNGGESGYHTSDGLQNRLYGSLQTIETKQENTGLLINDASINKDNMNELLDFMYSGYRDDYSNGAKYGLNTINNFGSLKGIDVASKIQGVLGLTTPIRKIQEKVEIGLHLLFASAGIPRVISGSEFINYPSYNKPESSPSEIPDEYLICKDNRFCYIKGEYKTLNWNSISQNGRYDNRLGKYRATYAYQFPSEVTMSKSSGTNVNQEALEKGLIYITYNYNAQNNGDIQKSILLINLSDQEVIIDNISDYNFMGVSPLCGKLRLVDGKVGVSSGTFYTFTEARDVRLPQWAYILIGGGLIALIFIIRGVAVSILNKRGIEYKKEKRGFFGFKKKDKNAKKEPSENIFKEYLKDDPLIVDAKNKLTGKNKEKTNDQSRETQDQEVKKEVDKTIPTKKTTSTKKSTSKKATTSTKKVTTPTKKTSQTKKNSPTKVTSSKKTTTKKEDK